MDSALLPPHDHDLAAPPFHEVTARLSRAAGMRDFAHAACERSRLLLLDDHDRRLRMRSWLLQPSPVPCPKP